jgi:hypothetical protein
VASANTAAGASAGAGSADRRAVAVILAQPRPRTTRGPSQSTTGLGRRRHAAISSR